MHGIANQGTGDAVLALAAAPPGYRRRTCRWMNQRTEPTGYPDRPSCWEGLCAHLGMQAEGPHGIVSRPLWVRKAFLPCAIFFSFFTGEATK